MSLSRAPAQRRFPRLPIERGVNPVTGVKDVVSKRIDAHVMKNSGFRDYLRFALVGMLFSICLGCVGISQQKDSLNAADDSSMGKTSGQQSDNPAVIKASAPAGVQSSDKQTVTSKTEDKPTFALLSEDEKARSMALDLAKATPGIKKIKICRDKKNDEWWLILYEDAGDHFQLKQYTWNVEQDRPEEFLIVKKVSKTRVDAHLAHSEPDRVCTVIGYDPERRLPVADSSDSTSQVTQRRQDAAPKTKTVPVSIAQEKPERKPHASSRPTQSPQTTTKAAQNEHDRPRNSATRQTVAKQPVSQPAERKAVAPPQTGDVVQATAKSSPTEISSVRQRTSPDPGASQSKTVHVPTPRARITSDSGVFSLATIRTEPSPVPVNRRTKTNSGLVQTHEQDKKSIVPNAGPALKESEKKSGLVAIDPSRDVPTCFIFVYGSGMNHQELMSWLNLNNYDPKVIVDAIPAVLHDHDLVWNYYSPSRRGGTVNIEPKKNSSVWGLLVEVEDRGLKAFDQKEGHPLYYKRDENRVSVKRSVDGRTVYAWLYRARPNKSERRDVWPTADYKEKIMQAALFWQFPQQYIEKIQRIPTR